MRCKNNTTSVTTLIISDMNYMVDCTSQHTPWDVEEYELTKKQRYLLAELQERMSEIGGDAWYEENENGEGITFYVSADDDDEANAVIESIDKSLLTGDEIELA